MKVNFTIFFIGILLVITPYSSATYQSNPTHLNGTFHYVGGTGPGNYSTIQDAIDNASADDIIFVYNDSSPYYENIHIDIPLTLLGEDTNSTIIDGSNSGDVVTITADAVIVNGFTIQYCGGTWSTAGIHIGSSDNNIKHNVLINVRNGIFIESCFNNTIDHNTIMNNGYHGIRIEYSSLNTITNNTIRHNEGNGIYLWYSSENFIVGNTIIKSLYSGIIVGDHSENNMFYHNNFINNDLEHAHDAWTNTWDNGEVGNYWDDYTGEDKNGDGIGDSPYSIIGGENQDHFPLMEPNNFEYPQVDISFSGGLGLIISMIDTDDHSRPFHYMVSINNDFLFRQESGEKYEGTIPLGEEIIISYNSPYFLCFGSFTVTVTIDDVYQVNQSGLIIGPFML